MFASTAGQLFKAGTNRNVAQCQNIPTQQLMARAVLSPPNAILFVFDPTNPGVAVPPYVDGELTAASATCVSVGTQADVDGDTEVSLDTTPTIPADLQRAFVGAIATPGRRLAVVTSQFERVLEIEVPDDSAEISIWVDDLRNPAHVAIGVGPGRCQSMK